jgi:hypothetical protein
MLLRWIIALPSLPGGVMQPSAPISPFHFMVTGRRSACILYLWFSTLMFFLPYKIAFLGIFHLDDL